MQTEGMLGVVRVIGEVARVRGECRERWVLDNLTYFVVSEKLILGEGKISVRMVDN